jgi:hypothetical protein
LNRPFTHVRFGLAREVGENPIQDSEREKMKKTLTFALLMLALTIGAVVALADNVPPGQVCDSVPAQFHSACTSCVAHLANGNGAQLSDIIFCTCKGASDAGVIKMGECLQLLK